MVYFHLFEYSEGSAMQFEWKIPYLGVKSATFSFWNKINGFMNRINGFLNKKNAFLLLKQVESSEISNDDS